ncbi:MAG TPA: alpha/beta hydrolase [Nocardioidaceae bacterium]|nr:alpha/beta hydrolase [Nocardioidaceae bacterium]
MDAPRGETVDLPDGRRLGFAEVGDPAGAPLVYFHGNPGSRLDYATERGHEALRAAGVRFIGTDRPGYGLSDAKPGRGHVDWPADVSALADALGLDRFAVLGYSRGGRYALACAALIPERLTAVGVLSGVGSPDMPGFAHTYARLVRMEFAFARRAPALWTKVTNSNVRRAKKHPGVVLAPFKLVLRDPADRAVIASYGREFAGSIVEAARQGPADWRMEETNQPDPLDFDLDEVKLPVKIWHGTADMLVPIAQGRHLASRLASAELVELQGVGHLHMPERLAQFAAELSRTTPTRPSS